MSLWLSAEELIELTGYKTSRRQKLALAEMNLRFYSRPLDGFPLVERWQFEGGIAQPNKSRHVVPNWGAIVAERAPTGLK